mmetsp:Transcript_37968/g.123514  ORF Transcript_37968/g.123514 Transcript_37968/m.123514 type:complete len:506 (+) Transcript_37968:942-2459(+)
MVAAVPQSAYAPHSGLRPRAEAAALGVGAFAAPPPPASSAASSTTALRSFLTFFFAFFRAASASLPSFCSRSARSAAASSSSSSRSARSASSALSFCHCRGIVRPSAAASASSTSRSARSASSALSFWRSFPNAERTARSISLESSETTARCEAIRARTGFLRSSRWQRRERASAACGSVPPTCRCSAERVRTRSSICSGVTCAPRSSEGISLCGTSSSKPASTASSRSSALLWSPGEGALAMRALTGLPAGTSGAGGCPSAVASPSGASGVAAPSVKASPSRQKRPYADTSSSSELLTPEEEASASERISQSASDHERPGATPGSAMLAGSSAKTSSSCAGSEDSGGRATASLSPCCFPPESRGSAAVAAASCNTALRRSAMGTRQSAGRSSGATFFQNSCSASVFTGNSSWGRGLPPALRPDTSPNRGSKPQRWRRTSRSRLLVAFEPRSISSLLTALRSSATCSESSSASPKITLTSSVHPSACAPSLRQPSSATRVTCAAG